jgi:hypothetical protein
VRIIGNNKESSHSYFLWTNIFCHWCLANQKRAFQIIEKTGFQVSDLNVINWKGKAMRAATKISWKINGFRIKGNKN